MKTTLIHFLALIFNINVNAQVEFSSHRGSSTHAPENTKASVMLAWEQGADAVEIDIHLSKDNRLMVIHDKSTKRTSGKDLLVKDTVSDTLQLLDVGSFKGAEFKNERIPFLEEIIELTPPSGILVIELKCGVEGLPVLQDIVNKSPKKNQLRIIAFDFEAITAAKKLLPENKSHLLIGKEENLKENIRRASQNGIDGIDLKHSLINHEIVSYVHDLSMKIYAWTVDDAAVAKRLVGLDVDGIESNCVPCLKEAMNK